MRRFLTHLIALTLSVCVFSQARAQENCKGSKYHKVLPLKVTFGSTVKQVIKAIEDKWGSNIYHLKLSETETTVRLRLTNAPFDSILLYHIGDTVHALTFSYSDGFMNSLGGDKNAITVLLDKLMEKAGRVDSHGEISTNNGTKGARARWKIDGGLQFDLRVFEPRQIFLDYECEPLKADLIKKRAANVNLGF